MGLSAKVVHAILAAVLFFVVSSPMLYQAVDKVVGGFVSSVMPQFSSVFKVAMSGCPTTYGIFLHSVVFGLASYFLVHVI